MARSAFLMSAKSSSIPPLCSPSMKTSIWYVCPWRDPHRSWPGRGCAQSMYSVIPSFISADEGPGRHKAWPAAASNRRDGHELQRFPPALEKLMLLVRLDEQDDAGAEREFLPVQDCDAATLGHDELMVPFVAVHRRESAFRDHELVHRGLSGSVLVTDQLFHLHVVTAVLQETDCGDQPDRGRIHVGLRGYPSGSLRVCAGRQRMRHASYTTGSLTPTASNASFLSRHETQVPQWTAWSQ